MDTLEEYFKGLLIEQESENAIETIVGNWFNESSEAQMSDVSDESLNSYIGTNTYFVFDPFPFLIFDGTGNRLSKIMQDYYKQALDDYNKHRSVYRTLKILPSFIKDTIQCTIFSSMTRAWVEMGYGDKIEGIKYLKDFYALKSDEVDEEFYSRVGSWHKLKDTIEKNQGNRLFTPMDMVTGTRYKSLQTSNVVYANGIYMNYDLMTLPVMNLLSIKAKDFDLEKNSINVEKGDIDKASNYENYLGYLITKCATYKDSLTQEVENVKSKKSFKTKTSTQSLNKNFDRANYTNTRLKKQSTDIDYWKDSASGQAVDWLNKNANGSGEEADAWNKTVNNLSHTFNRTKLDTDLEKWYNRVRFLPDVLGMEADDYSRYDARKYEDPNRRKIKGVAGYDIYKKDIKIQELEDEIKELKNDISNEEDPKKIEELEKHIKSNEDEIEIIKQALDSEEERGDRVEKKYQDKVKNMSNNQVDEKDIDKGIKYVLTHNNDLSVFNKYLTNR